MPAIRATPVPEPQAEAMRRELVAMFLARYRSDGSDGGPSRRRRVTDQA